MLKNTAELMLNDKFKIIKSHEAFLDLLRAEIIVWYRVIIGSCVARQMHG